jgi:hypothetical protein
VLSNRRASPRLPAVLLLVACARSKETPRVATVASSDASVCRALAAPGALEARLAGALPLQLGGALFVFGGTSHGAVLRALDPFGVSDVKVVGCDSGKVVVFVPGLKARDLRALEQGIVAGSGAHTEESVCVAPQRTGPIWTAGVCHTLVEPGSPTERFGRVFPIHQGGVVLVFEGTNKAAVDAAFAALELRLTKVVGCGESDVVTFIPGADASRADRVEAYVLANVRGAKTKERAVFQREPPHPI